MPGTKLLWKSDKLITEATTYTMHNKHKTRTTMLSAQFKPTIPSTKQLQTYVLKHMAPGIGSQPELLTANKQIIK